MIVPALRELSLVRSLDVRITWGELQEMPDEMLDVWEAILAGEADGRKMKG